MNTLNNSQLIQIVGGGFSAALLNSISRGVNTILELGRLFGTSVRMMVTGKRC